MEGYIYKNYLTVHENPEIFVIEFDDGSQSFGTEKEISGLLGTDKWQCGDAVTETEKGLKMQDPVAYYQRWRKEVSVTRAYLETLWYYCQDLNEHSKRRDKMARFLHRND